MIKDQILVKNMLDIINTLLEASQYLYNAAKNKNYNSFAIVSDDMHIAINSIYNTIIEIKKEENIVINVDLACENAIYSLQKIIKFSKSRSIKILDKIEFELIPILEDMYLQLYFWGSIYPDKNKIENYYKNDVAKLFFNKYIDEAEKKGEFKYDLSVIVLGYNKLSYTKLCIENLLKYIPQNLNYELILVNHGSTDDTEEYFKSIESTKQLDLLKNGGSPTVIDRIVEGKYFSLISNDVIVTENAIENMLKCMESDIDIAWVVPTTPNVSNDQTIDAKYTNMDEMHEFAKKNNISNKYRWEQKCRLCNPIDLKKSSIWISSKGITPGGYFHTNNMMSFPDDKVSMILRRNGYKMMLAKDAYCHHFGSVTLSEEINSYEDENGRVGAEEFYKSGRIEFYNTFGIDPWSKGFTPDYNLIKALQYNYKKDINILGINCGMGSNPLKIKDRIKEESYNLDTKIYNVTDEQQYFEDLKGVSDKAYYIKDLSNLDKILNNIKFNYIIFEGQLDTCDNVVQVLKNLQVYISDGGIIAMNISDLHVREELKNIGYRFTESGNWIIL